MKKLALVIAFLAGQAAHAETARIGSELLQIEGPPDLVQSLRDSYALDRPKAKKPLDKKKDAKHRKFAANKSREQSAND